jgi:hypothetical protein
MTAPHLSRAVMAYSEHVGTKRQTGVPLAGETYFLYAFTGKLRRYLGR